MLMSIVVFSLLEGRPSSFENGKIEGHVLSTSLHAVGGEVPCRNEVNERTEGGNGG